ncbi:hypothetical protein [Pseudomonas agarici]
MTNTTSTKEHIEQRENLRGIPFAAVAELRDYFAASVTVDLDGYGVNYAESIVGRKMPDFAADPLSNQIFWADFRARMRYAEADAMLAARST